MTGYRQVKIYQGGNDMSRGTNQKFKFTYLMKIMLDKTDDEHGLTMSQIIQELEMYGITAERKSIYMDFQDMTEKFGIEIMKEKVGREIYYHVAARTFELAEVKLLIDAIQSSKFITSRKSKELIKKIKSFCSLFKWAFLLSLTTFLQIYLTLENILALRESN